MNFKFLTIIFLILTKTFFAQQEIKYTPAFKFTDGIFINIQQVKENNPIKKTQIVTNIDYKSFDFFEQLFEEKNIKVYDNIGTLKELNPEKIWGFSDRGVLYININGSYNRIPVFGNICHFIADKTFVDYNPVYYNSYGRNNFQNSNFRQDNYNTKTVMVQYLLDFETGKIYEFTYKSVEKLIIKDVELYEEFSKLSKRKKKKLKFLYIRKYNKKHPVYFNKNF